MSTPTYLFHNFTGMRFKYTENHPMLKNPQVSVLDEDGKPYRPVKRITLKKSTPQESRP